MGNEIGKQNKNSKSKAFKPQLYNIDCEVKYGFDGLELTLVKPILVDAISVRNVKSNKRSYEQDDDSDCDSDSDDSDEDYQPVNCDELNLCVSNVVKGANNLITTNDYISNKFLNVTFHVYNRPIHELVFSVSSTFNIVNHSKIDTNILANRVSRLLKDKKCQRDWKFLLPICFNEKGEHVDEPHILQSTSTIKLKVFMSNNSDGVDVINGQVVDTTKFLFFSRDKKIHLLNDNIYCNQGAYVNLFDESKFDITTFKVAGHDQVITKVISDLIKPRTIPIEIQRKIDVKHRLGAIIHGPPGTGKTTFVKEIAQKLNASFTVVRGPELKNWYVGKTEHNIRQVFAPAISDFKENGEYANFYVYLLDEIDSIAPNREFSKSDNGNDSINQLLASIGGFDNTPNILIFGTTNRLSSIDPALYRSGRLDCLIYFPPPTIDGRKAIFDRYLRDKSEFIDKSVDSSALAKMTCGYTGADIEKLVNQATTNKFISGVAKSKKDLKFIKIDQGDFVNAIKSFPIDNKASFIMWNKVFEDFCNELMDKVSLLVKNKYSTCHKIGFSSLMNGNGQRFFIQHVADLLNWNHVPINKDILQQKIQPQTIFSIDEMHLTSDIVFKIESSKQPCLLIVHHASNKYDQDFVFPSISTKKQVEMFFNHFEKTPFAVKLPISVKTCLNIVEFN